MFDQVSAVSNREVRRRKELLNEGRLHQGEIDEIVYAMVVPLDVPEADPQMNDELAQEILDWADTATY